MITLTQSTQLNGYQVHATLRKREKNHPFIAVLLLAKEQGGWIDPASVHQNLLPALPPKASQNLLERLNLQGYLEALASPILPSPDLPILREAGFLTEEIPSFHQFQLTEFGWESAQAEEIWVPMKGVYDFQLVESPFVEQRVVGLDLRPSLQDDRKKDRQPNQTCPKSLKGLIGTTFQLGKEEYRLEALEEKCFFLPKETAKLTLQADPQKGVQVIIEAKQLSLSFQQDLLRLTHASIREELLRNAVPDQYHPAENWLSVPFDAKQLAFERAVHLAKPELQGETFQSISLPQIAHQPDTEETAQDWFEAMLHQQLDRYFFSETEFREFQEEFRGRFLAYSPSLLSREALLAQLPPNPKHFYARMKLRAPQLLS
ncbi:MAG: hypothetical protein AAF399_17880 [Bacteroidota bacterium]